MLWRDLVGPRERRQKQGPIYGGDWASFMKKMARRDLHWGVKGVDRLFVGWGAFWEGTGYMVAFQHKGPWHLRVIKRFKRWEGAGMVDNEVQKLGRCHPLNLGFISQVWCVDYFLSLMGDGICSKLRLEQAWTKHQPASCTKPLQSHRNTRWTTRCMKCIRYLYEQGNAARTRGHSSDRWPSPQCSIPVEGNILQLSCLKWSWFIIYHKSVGWLGSAGWFLLPPQPICWSHTWDAFIWRSIGTGHPSGL